MKKILLLIVALILASCSDQFSVDSVVDAPIEQTANSDVKMLIEKARRGDGKASKTNTKTGSSAKTGAKTSPCKKRTDNSQKDGTTAFC